MKQNVVFISARRGYITEGLRAEGFDVVKPYKDKTVIGRILREIWFRNGLPEKIWYTEIKEGIKNIIVQDPLITKKYLEWLVKRHPKSKIHFLYGNMLGKAKHILPDEVPFGIIIWTFDPYNAKEHGLNLINGGYLKSFIGKKKETKYDVFYVGADKGRGEYLLDLKKEIENMGMKAKFIITADSRFAKKKKYYSNPISYSEVVEYVNESRAVINIVMPNQKGATMRDFESVFNGVKLITNNQFIREFTFFKEENVFIIGERPLSDLPSFLDTPFSPIEPEIKDNLTMEKVVERITGYVFD